MIVSSRDSLIHRALSKMLVRGALTPNLNGRGLGFILKGFTLKGTPDQQSELLCCVRTSQS